MAEGLFAFLYRDLSDALQEGARRTSAAPPGGALWLVRWALLSALVGLTLFLFCGYHGGFIRLNGLAVRLPDWIWQWLTVLGDERVAFGLALFFTRRYPRVFWALVTAALLGIAFTHSLKPLFSALRPPAVLEGGVFNLIGPAHRKTGFPSGHTVTATIFFGVWVFYARSNWLRTLLVMVAVAVGLSRVVVGVHWPVDIAAGSAGGAVVVWLGASLARRSMPFGLDPSVHLAMVTLSAVMAISLLLWDGGYGGAADLQRSLGVAALGYAASVYMLGPTVRWLTVRRGEG